MMRRTWLCLLLLAGCTPSSPAPYTHSDTAFDQLLALTLHGMMPEQAQALASTATADLHFIEEVSHPWHPGPLGRTNQLLAMGGDFSANPSLLPLIRRATRLAEASQGYYNPALGKLRASWGLQQDFPGETLPPSSDTLDAMLSQDPRMQDIQIDGIRMHGGNPALRIDFGPYAQGYALDTAMMRLRESGVPQARLENGDFTLQLGDASDGTPPVKVALQGDKEVAIALIADEALVRLDTRERRYLDPRSGRPVASLIIAAVIAASAADAAAAAQALLVSPPSEHALLLQQMGIRHALVQREGEALSLTPAMAERLRGTLEQPQHLMVKRQ